MAERVTKAQVGRMFALFCKTFGLRMATSARDAGGYALDNYRGYQVVQLTERGGESQPFGSTRYSPREFVNVLYFAVEVARHQENARQNAPRRNRGQRHHPGPSLVHDMSDLPYRGFLIRTNALTGDMWIEKGGQLIAHIPAAQSWQYARDQIDSLLNQR